MNKNVVAASFFILGLVFASPCRAYGSDGASFEIGSGVGNGAEMWRIGVYWDWKRKWLETGNWHVGGYWEAQVGQWSGPGKRTVTDLGLTPVFRFQQTSPAKISPYVEAAIGFHLISPTSFDENRHFSTAYQFGDHIGAGARFGERGRYDLSLRFQHLSNGGIKQPNDGINFLQLRLQHHLE
jgi:lipid A 3-O-deacylase